MQELYDLVLKSQKAKRASLTSKSRTLDGNFPQMGIPNTALAATNGLQKPSSPAYMTKPIPSDSEKSLDDGRGTSSSNNCEAPQFLSHNA